MRLVLIALLLLTPAVGLWHAGAVPHEKGSCGCCDPLDALWADHAHSQEWDPHGVSCTCFQHRVRWTGWDPNRSLNQTSADQLPATRHWLPSSMRTTPHPRGLADPASRLPTDLLGVLLI